MSIIALLIVVFIILIAILVAGAMYHYAQMRRLEQQQEQSALTIVQLEAQVKVTQKNLEQMQQAEREQIISTAVVSSMDQAVIVLDAQGVIALFNPAAEHLTGLFRVDVLKKPYQEVLQFSNQKGEPELEAVRSGMMGHTAVFPKWTFVTNRTTKIPFTGTVTPITNPDGTRSVALALHDATQEFKEVEEEKAFFSAAAHELRSPLSTIRAVISLLVSDIETMPKEKARDMLRDTLEYTGHLMLLVNDYLSVSRLEQGRIELKREPFDMLSLVHGVIETTQLQARERKLYLHHQMTELTPKVLGDKEKTGEILTNLISNALKYTHQGGVEVTHRVEGAFVATIVTDTGVGIATENHRLLFRKFQQIGTARNLSASKSTGLGLYIAKKLAQLMKGDLVLERSEPGVGTSFKLLLPLAPHDQTVTPPTG